jgi:hypothetical protein
MALSTKSTTTWRGLLTLTSPFLTVGRVWLAVVMVTPIPLWAQTPGQQGMVQPGAEAPQTLEPVVVTGRADDLTGIARAASEGQTGQAQLATRPLLRPAEVLEVVPGLVATQHSGAGKANQYLLRGFDLDHGTDFSTFVDGVPINFPTHAHGQGYMDLNWLIPEIVDYVHFRKGPYYADVGDFSSVGTADIHLVKTLPEGLVKVGVGQDDFYRVVVAQTPQLGPGHLLYAIEGQYYNGPWDTPQHQQKFDGVFKYTLERGPTTFTLGATAYYSQWHGTNQIPQRAVDEGLIGRFGNLSPSDGGRSQRYSLYANWDTKGDHSHTAANAYLLYYRLNLFSDFTFFLDDPVHGDQVEQVDRRVVVGGSAAQTWFTTWLGDTMDHTVGLQVRHDAMPQVALFHTEDRARLLTQSDDAVHETNVGFYYQNTTQWLPTIRTVIGLREDVFVFDVHSNLAGNSGNHTNTIFSPKASLIVGPWARTEVYLNGGYGFHSNDARGITHTVSVNPLGQVSPVQPVTPLVRSKGAEVGVRSTWLPGLNTTLAFWYLTLAQELVFDGNTGTSEPTRPSERYGVEWTNFYTATSWLTLDFDLAQSHARYTTRDPEAPGLHIPGSLETMIAAGATVTVPNGLFGSLRLRYFGPRPLIEDNRVRSQATTLVNLETGYKYKNLVAQLDVLNLFNSHQNDIAFYYASRLPGEPAAGVNDLHFHPLEPRLIRFYLTYKF